MKKFIKIKQIKSSIGILPKHKLTLIGLGLKYIGHTVIRKNTPEIIGMIKKINHIILVKEI